MKNDLRFLSLLAKEYPTIEKANEEIIKLQAILHLPKGTEHFISDIHGEYASLNNILRNASGVIKMKIDMLFEKEMSDKDRNFLAALIYYPEQRLNYLREQNQLNDEWYKENLSRLIDVCKSVASKYTRSHVRRITPQNYKYNIDELLNMSSENENKSTYYSGIINSVIENNCAEEFIVILANLIHFLAIDRLHIIGDIFDRGPEPNKVIDLLMKYGKVDIQWGNHDVLWMGAASGSNACIANVIRIACRYNSLDTIESAYGINLRPLATFAMEVYKNDKCEMFKPITSYTTSYQYEDFDIVSKMHKAIAIIQLKLEGQLIKKYPEFEMDSNLFLDKMDLDKGEIIIDGVKCKLTDTSFPTLDKNNPYKLTTQESELVERLHDSFKHSASLKRHIDFIYSKGTMYTVSNENLLFHGCIPLNEDGSFKKLLIKGQEYSGKSLLDKLDSLARDAFTSKSEDVRRYGRDFLWYMWCGASSPVFGRSKSSSFKAYFISEEKVRKEISNHYYNLIEKEEIIDKIFEEFGLKDGDLHIINGHVPVKAKQGESPVKANGRLIVIDGGLSKPYQEKTGIAGYTLMFNSHGMNIVSHTTFEGIDKIVKEGSDVVFTKSIIEKVKDRIMVETTDEGEKIKNRVSELKELVEAYKKGLI